MIHRKDLCLYLWKADDWGPDVAPAAWAVRPLFTFLLHMPVEHTYKTASNIQTHMWCKQHCYVSWYSCSACYGPLKTWKRTVLEHISYGKMVDWLDVIQAKWRAVPDVPSRQVANERHGVRVARSISTPEWGAATPFCSKPLVVCVALGDLSRQTFIWVFCCPHLLTAIHLGWMKE